VIMPPAAAVASIFRREIRFEMMLMDEFLRLWAWRPMSARGAGEMFRIRFASLACSYDRAELQDQHGTES
jgi:hypothetical protein